MGKSSSAETDHGVLVENKLTMSQPHAPVAKRANSISGCIRRSVASRIKGGGPSPLFSTGERHLECWVHF